MMVAPAVMRLFVCGLPGRHRREPEAEVVPASPDRVIWFLDGNSVLCLALLCCWMRLRLFDWILSLPTAWFDYNISAILFDF